MRDKAVLGAIFTDLCSKLGQDLQRQGYVAKTIGIKLRYDDFRIATRDQTADTYTADGQAIRKLAGLCLKRVPLEKSCVCWAFAPAHWPKPVKSRCPNKIAISPIGTSATRATRY